MDLLKESASLAHFTQSLFEWYCNDSLGSAFLADNNFNDRLVWVDFLCDTRVRLVLTVALADRCRGIQLASVSHKLSNEAAKRVLVLSAVSALQLYVTDNFQCFIDPDQNEPFADCLVFIEDLFELEDDTGLGLAKLQYELNCDGERPYPIVRNSVLLRLSRLILTSLTTLDCFETDSECFHLLLWSLRATIIHQISLQAAANSLYDESLLYIDRLFGYLESTDHTSLRHSLKLDLLNEMLSVLSWYGDVERCKKYAAIAMDLTGIEFGLTGQLGLRTNYQLKPVSQLMVEVKRKHISQQDPSENEALGEESSQPEQKISLPRNEPLEDDTLLQETKYLTSEESAATTTTQVELAECEQCLLIGHVKLAYRHGPSEDNLLHEQLLTYIYYLLERTTVWSARFDLLELRSVHERSSRRKIERSMKQLETLTGLVRSFNGSQLKREASQRSQHFYSVLPSPFWIVEKHLAELLLSLGVVKSALEVFLRLELWHDVINCYRQLNRLDKAEEVVRQKLLHHGDNQPELHCLLGELTGDVQCFHHAWDISGGKCSRAQKMLGLHHFRCKDMEQALTHFEQSIEVNSMQTDVWYRIGFISLTQQNWERAANAYRRVLQFEPESYEAWNNLSKAYIKLDDKPRAFRTLQEAIKCNFEEWKIWDNFIAVCGDVGEFGELIEAWNRLIDIKGSYIDDLIATVLVTAILLDTVDADGNGASRLMPRALKLFGRIASTSAGSPKVWQLYAKLLLQNQVVNGGEITKVSELLNKSYRQFMAIHPQWHKDLDKTGRVLVHCFHLSGDFLYCAELAGPDQSGSILHSFQMSLNSVMIQANKARQDFGLASGIAPEQLTKLDSVLAECQQKLERIKEKGGCC